MKKISIIIYSTTSLFLTSANQVSGEIVTYTNKTDFLNAITTTDLESFESLAVLPSPRDPKDPIVTPKFTISVLAGRAYFRSSGIAGHFATHGSKYYDLEEDNGQRKVTFTFLQPQTAFAISVTDFGDNLAGVMTLSTNVGEASTPITVASNPPGHFQKLPLCGLIV